MKLKSKLLAVLVASLLAMTVMFASACNGGGITSVTVTPASPTVNVGATVQLSAAVAGDDEPRPQTVTWTTSDAAIATVSATGLVTGVAPGSATIRATSTVDTSVYGTATVTVTPAPAATVTAVNVTPSASTVNVGAGAQLSAAVVGTNNPAQTVTWTVQSGGDYATVSAAGLVTGVAEGTATIRATSTVNTAISGTATVTVIPAGTFQVTFVMDGETVHTATVESGTTVSEFTRGEEIIMPTAIAYGRREGGADAVSFMSSVSVDGWYNGDTRFDFSTIVTGNLTLTAGSPWVTDNIASFTHEGITQYRHVPNVSFNPMFTYGPPDNLIVTGIDRWNFMGRNEGLHVFDGNSQILFGNNVGQHNFIVFLIVDGDGEVQWAVAPNEIIFNSNGARLANNISQQTPAGTFQHDMVSRFITRMGIADEPLAGDSAGTAAGITAFAGINTESTNAERDQALRDWLLDNEFYLIIATAATAQNDTAPGVGQVGPWSMRNWVWERFIDNTRLQAVVAPPTALHAGGNPIAAPRGGAWERTGGAITFNLRAGDLNIGNAFEPAVPHMSFGIETTHARIDVPAVTTTVAFGELVLNQQIPNTVGVLILPAFHQFFVYDGSERVFFEDNFFSMAFSNFVIMDGDGGVVWAFTFFGDVINSDGEVLTRGGASAEDRPDAPAAFGTDGLNRNIFRFMRFLNEQDLDDGAFYGIAAADAIQTSPGGEGASPAWNTALLNAADAMMREFLADNGYYLIITANPGDQRLGTSRWFLQDYVMGRPMWDAVAEEVVHNTGAMFGEVPIGGPGLHMTTGGTATFRLAF